MPEIWKPVPGYKGAYEVSNQGRVRSLDRRIVFDTAKGKRQVWRRGQELTPVRAGYRDGANGLLQVTLCKNGESESKAVARLVLTVFGVSAPKWTKSVHYDADYTNNALRNLDFIFSTRRKRRK